MLVLKYKLKGKATKETIRSCKKGAKGMQGILTEGARIINPKLKPLMWLFTRIYFTKITDKAITFTFPMFLNEKKVITKK